jgi:hypothetical protein
MTSTALAMSDVSAIPRPESGRATETRNESVAALRVVESAEEHEPITLGALLREVLAEMQADCPVPDLPQRSR